MNMPPLLLMTSNSWDRKRPWKHVWHTMKHRNNDDDHKIRFICDGMLPQSVVEVATVAVAVAAFGRRRRRRRQSSYRRRRHSCFCCSKPGPSSCQCCHWCRMRRRWKCKVCSTIRCSRDHGYGGGGGHGALACLPPTTRWIFMAWVTRVGLCGNNVNRY